MDVQAIRPVDPAELPELVEQAVAIADGAMLSEDDRAILLPLIYGTLTARVVIPPMPAIMNGAGLRLPPGLGGL